MCAPMVVVVAVVFSAARGRGGGVGSGVAAEKVLVTTGVHGVGARNAAAAAVRPRRRRPAGRCRAHHIYTYDKFCRVTRADADGTCILHHAYIILY